MSTYRQTVEQQNLENKNEKKNNSMDTSSGKLRRLHTSKYGYGQEREPPREKLNLF